MRIKQLSIKNFGPIKSFLVEPKGQLLGVVGSNGQGKSHVLKALRFLFANHLSDTNASFIHVGEKSADLEAVFEVGDQEGRMQKRILKSGTKNSFKWEGKEYTKAEPITRVIEDIFQTKRESLMEVAFRFQGDLSGILFGYDSVREQLFSNLLSVDFTKARDILQTKGNVLKAQFSDLTAVLEEEKARMVEADALMKKCAAELEALPAESLTTYRELKEKLEVFNSVNALRGSIGDLGKQLEEIETQLKDLRGYESWENNNKELEKMRNELSDKQAMLTALKNVEEWHQRATRLQESREAQQKELEAVSKQLEGIPETDISTLSDKVTLLRERVEKADKYKELSTYHPILKTRLEKLQERLETAGEEIASCTKKLEQVSADARTLSRLLAVRKEISETTGADEEKPECGKCGLVLDRDALLLLSEDAIRKIEEQQAELSSQEEKLSETLQSLKKDHTTLDTDENRLRKLLAEAETNLNELAPFKEVDVDATKTELQQAKDTLEKRQKLLEERSRLKERQNNLVADVKKLETEIEEVGQKIKASDAEIKEIGQIPDRESVVNKLKTDIDARTKLQESNRAGWEAYRSSRSSKDVVQKQLSDSRERLSTLLKESGTSMTQQQQKDLQASMEKYEDIIQQEKTLRELLSERTRTYEQSKARVARLNLQMKGDAELRALVNKVEQARSLLGRSGIPGIYMRERFLQIAELTQHYLQQVGANFVVFPEDNSLRFNFVQPEKYEDAELSMDKLSGGQRIRLSVAFLMAAGQLLTPNFQFLTLDEPSTHLDEEGKDSLISLFEQLAAQLANGDQQVWVVDHEPMFMRAFDEVYQL